MWALNVLIVLGAFGVTSLSVHRAKSCMSACVCFTCTLTFVFILVSIFVSWKPPIQIKQQRSCWLSSLSTCPMLRNLAAMILSAVTDLISFPTCAQSCLAAPAPSCIPVQMPSSPHTRLGPPQEGLSHSVQLWYPKPVALGERHIHPSWGTGFEDSTSYSLPLPQVDAYFGFYIYLFI